MTVEASKSKDREPGLVIVLVRPQLAENVGAAARAMLNFGLTELRLVAPRHRWPDAAAYRAGEVSYIELLTAQRSFAQMNLDYVEALGELRAALVEIDGLLLKDSLESDR